VFRADCDELKELPEPPGKKRAGYFGCVGAGGEIWVAQDHFFGKWNGTNWEPSPLAEKITNGFQAAGLGVDGSLLVFGDGKLLRIADGKIQSERNVPEGCILSNLWGIDEDREGTVWLNTSNYGLFGICCHGDILHYTSTHGLTCDSIRFAFEDLEHNLWVGSSGGGLLRFRKRTFVNYDLEDGLPERAIKALVEEKSGGILVGTFGKGMARLEGKRISPIVASDGGRFGPYVQCLLRDRQENIWLGTYGEGIQIMREGMRHVIPASFTGGSLSAALFEDSNGQIWIGGDETVSVFANGTFAPQKRAPPGVRCFAESLHDHSIWAGTAEGVFRYEGDSWTEVKMNRKSIARTSCLHPEPDGTMWIGAYGLGLLRRRGDSDALLTEREGLPTRNIASIVEDNAGSWWFGSDRGVIRADRKDLEDAADRKQSRLTCQVFDRGDGLGSIECAGGFQSTALKDRQGKLYFATTKGLGVVNPALVPVNTNSPRIHFESVSYIDAKSGHKSFASETNFIRIPAGNGQIEVYTAALCYAGSEKVQLEYRLLHGRNVISGGKQRSRLIVLGWLPPGQYVLSVVAANNDGVWSPENNTLNLVVEPYFWQTAWFRFVFLCSSIALACFAAWHVSRSKLRQHIRRLQQQREIESARANERKQAADELREANVRLHKLSAHLIDLQESERRFIAKELHDEIGQSLTAASLNFRSAAAGKEPQRNQSFEDGIMILNEVLGQVRDLSLDLRPSMLDHVGLPAAIRWQVDRIAQRVGIKAEVSADDYALPSNADLEIACYRIVQEALTNVARHAKARNVRVELHASEKGVNLLIKDDGIGFDPGAVRQQGKSFGIFSMEERASLLGGNMTIDSARGNGTAVIVQVPVKTT
jgi:signal transduction histidine kinase